MDSAAAPGPPFSVRATPDGIVRLYWSPGLQISGELAEAAMRTVNDLNTTRPRPLLVDMTGTARLSRTAREVFMRPCAVSRLALVGRSAVDRVIANFAVGVGRHAMPMRFFTAEPAAVAWLADAAAQR